MSIHRISMRILDGDWDIVTTSILEASDKAQACPRQSECRRNVVERRPFRQFSAEHSLFQRSILKLAAVK